MSSADPQHRSLAPTLTGLWLTRTANGGCEIVTQATMSLEASTNAGAPKSIATKLTVSGDGRTLDWDVVQVDKRPTRLPEATFFSFVPALPGAGKWELTVLGSKMDPTDVLGAVGESYPESTYGGSVSPQAIPTTA